MTQATSSVIQKRALIIRHGAMGDLVHMATAVQVARQYLPDVQFDVLSAPAYTALLSTFSLFDHVLVYDKKRGWPGIFALGQAFRVTGYDVIVNLHPSFKTWVLSHLARPKRQVVYRKQKLSVFGIAQREIPRRHAVADFYEPLRQVFDLPLAPPVDSIMPPALALPASLGESTPLIGLILGVGGKRSNRAWPLTHFKTLIGRFLAETPYELALIGGTEEAALAQEVMAAFPEARQRLSNHVGHHASLLDTAALLGRCALVIGGDTGPTHLASTFHNLPIIGIYGPTSVARTGPVGLSRFRQTLIPPSALECWPCEQPVCPLSGDSHLACVQQIPPEAVFEASMNWLKQAP